jgi:hypothetical protein
MTIALMQGAGISGGPPVGVLIVAILGSIPLLGIMAWAAVKILGPVAQAFSRRLAGGGESHLENRIEALAEELGQLKAQLAETHERLDFTERLMAQGRVHGQLPRN